MAVRTDHRVGKQPCRRSDNPLAHHFGKVLDMDLVDDALSRRHHPKAGEGRLGPFEEGKTLPIIGEFAAQIVREGPSLTRDVDHGRMVHH